MKKINVLVISSSLKNKGGITSVIKGHFGVKQSDVQFFHLSSHKDGCIFIKMIYFINALIKLPFILMFKHIDLVHIHMSEKGSFFRKKIITDICKLFRKKIVIHHHGAEFVVWYDSQNKTKKKKIKRMLERVDYNIVLSNLTLKQYKSVFGIDNVVCVHNSVNVPDENIYTKNNKDIVLFLGRIGVRKGAFDLIEAIKNVENLQDIKFYFCGDGDIEKMEELVKNYNLENRVVVKKWIAGEEKENILNRAIINVLPSYNEGLPMTILETMARGIPNISTNIASIPEVIDEKNGILIEPGDIESLKEKMVYLLNNQAAIKEMSDNSYQKVKCKFSTESKIKELFALYEKLTGKEKVVSDE